METYEYLNIFYIICESNTGWNLVKTPFMSTSVSAINRSVGEVLSIGFQSSLQLPGNQKSASELGDYQN